MSKLTEDQKNEILNLIRDSVVIRVKTSKVDDNHIVVKVKLVIGKETFTSSEDMFYIK